MRFTSRAVAAAAVASISLTVAGCSSHDYAASPVPAILTDREAVRLAELHLNVVAPQANPRDVVTVEPTSDGHLVGFQTFFDETQLSPKQSRLVLVKHDGRANEVTFRD